MSDVRAIRLDREADGSWEVRADGFGVGFLSEPLAEGLLSFLLELAELEPRPVDEKSEEEA